MADYGDLLIMKLAVLAISAQNTLGNLTFNLMHLARSAKVLFILFATPFYCGVPLTMKWWVMPSNSQNLMNSLSLYSSSLSILRYFFFPASLIFNSCFPLYKYAKHIRLMLNKINPYLSRVAINETDERLSTAMRRNWYWTPNI